MYNRLNVSIKCKMIEKEIEHMPKDSKTSTQTTNKPFDFILFVTVLVLLAMGIIMVLSASSPSALAESRK